MKLSYLKMDSFPNARITQTVVIDRKFGGKPWAETPQRLLHFAAVSIEVHGHGRGPQTRQPQSSRDKNGSDTGSKDTSIYINNIPSGYLT